VTTGAGHLIGSHFRMNDDVSRVNDFFTLGAGSITRFGERNHPP